MMPGTNFVKQETQVTSSALMNIVSGEVQRGKMLLIIFQEHNSLIGKDYAKGAICRSIIIFKCTANVGLLATGAACRGVRKRRNRLYRRIFFFYTLATTTRILSGLIKPGSNF